MASEIKVTNVKANDGTASLTVANSTGAVATGQNLTVGGTLTSTGAITASGGIANAGTITAGTLAFQSMAIWRMVNDETKGDQNPLGGGGSDWELSAETETEFYLGSSTQVTESSGIWSFGSTGYWSIRGGFTVTNNSDNVQNMTIKMQASNDGAGGTWNSVSLSVMQDSSIGTGYGQTFMAEVLLKITNTTNDKFKVYHAADPDTLCVGHASANRTWLGFQKLADI